MLISVVSPVYGCKACLDELHARLVQTLEGLTDSFEIILVNDASPDAPWELIKDLAQRDKRVKGINLSRNFGQHYALRAGLDHSKGDWVIVMDCDLQCDPAEIIKLYEKAKEGYDVVFTKIKQKKEPYFKALTSEMFYNVYNYLTGMKIEKSLSSMNIANRRVVDVIRSMKEHHQVHFLFLKWAGFRSAIIEIDHNKRFAGKSSYDFKKRIRLAVNTFLTFSDKPLRLAIRLGFYLSCVSAVFMTYKIVGSLLHGHQVLGWASLIASIFFSTGLIISVLGVVGLYVGKIFEEVKNRPLYVAKDLLNFNE
ncbi:MAG: glycosyltransferase family 2 protein [Chitinophagaceae bacterium]|nr:glycosyltransferase family 2 protein [Chitinophagaceae bacterium]